ncbi:MAG: hypothetical protein WCK78_04140 [Paludibacter sp.]
MKTRKRTLVKSIFLSVIRYERWKSNPKNIDKMIYMEQYKHMIGFVCMICFVFFAVGCKPVQQITKIKTDSVVSATVHAQTSVEQHQTTNVQENSAITAKTESEKSIIELDTDKSVISGTLVVYDTSKPVDERTGKPPIKSELSWTHNKDIERKYTQSQNFNTSVNQKKDLNAEQVIASKAKEEIKSKSKSEVKTEITEKSFANTSVILFVIIGIIVLYFIVSKTTPIGFFTKIIHFFRKKQ